MNPLTRRNFLTSSAAGIAAPYFVSDVIAKDATDENWDAVDVHLHFRQAQSERLKPVMEDVFDTFACRFLIQSDNGKHPGVVSGGVYIELLDHRVEPHHWTFIHDEGGSILLATGTEQLKAALKYLRSIARAHPAPGLFDSPDAYYQSGLPVIELPKGVTTSLPVHHRTRLTANRVMPSNVVPTPLH